LHRKENLGIIGGSLEAPLGAVVHNPQPINEHSLIVCGFFRKAELTRAMGDP